MEKISYCSILRFFASILVCATYSLITIALTTLDAAFLDSSKHGPNASYCNFMSCLVAVDESREFGFREASFSDCDIIILDQEVCWQHCRTC